jgi:hypothetical protein
MAEHILDVNCRMGYKREFVEKQAQDFRDWTRFSIATSAGRFSTIGIGTYLNPIDLSFQQYKFARSVRAPGHCFFSYLATSREKARNREARTDDGFYRRMREELYARPVPLPRMAWKDYPTEGIIAGWVFNSDYTHADGATIVLRASRSFVESLPVAKRETIKQWKRSIRADAGGFYAFTRLAPAVYDVYVEEPLSRRTLAEEIKLDAGKTIIMKDPRTTPQPND